METERARTQCIRCGQCCLRASPTLQMEDGSRISDGHLHQRDLYTLRVGELVYDNINEKHVVNDVELIKIRERDDDSGCVHYDEQTKGCKIYDHRPLQCSAFACWEPQVFMRVHKGPKLSRKEIIRDPVLLGLIHEHEKKCSYFALEKRIRRIQQEGERAVQGILELLKFDYAIRPFVSKKLGIDLEEMDLVFGRPLTETIVMFGLEVTRKPDGSFFLSVHQGWRLT